jgi:hypothetical protein
MLYHPEHKEILDYLRDVRRDLRLMLQQCERKNKTLKIKAAIATFRFLDQRIDQTLLRYADNKDYHKVADLQIQKLVFGDVMEYWRKIIK